MRIPFSFFIHIEIHKERIHLKFFITFGLMLLISQLFDVLSHEIKSEPTGVEMV